MTGRGVRGRADLARALALLDTADEERFARIASALDYEREDTRARHLPPVPPVPEPPTPDDLPINERAVADVPFLYAARFTPRDATRQRTSEHNTTEPVAFQGWRERPTEAPPYPALAPWRLLEPRLRACLAPPAASREIDTALAVERLARAELVERFPGLQRRRWTRRLRVILDRSAHLTPYWRDQEVVTGALRRLLPQSDIETIVLDAASGSFRLVDQPDYPLVEPDATDEPVLVLGDLGVLGMRPELDGQRWLRLAQRLSRRHAMVLSPADPGLFPSDLRAAWNILGWDAVAIAQAVPFGEQRALAARLLRLLSPAVRIEPGLLRVVRRRLMPEAPASVEALAWRHPAMRHGSSIAGTLDTERRGELRAGFEQEDAAVRAEALDLVRAWHAGLDEAVWFEEVLDLPASSAGLVPHSDREDAKAYFQRLRRVRRSNGTAGLGQNVRAWLGRVGARTEAAWQDAAFREVVWSVKQHDLTFKPPVAPGVVPLVGAAVGSVALAQSGDRLRLEAGLETSGSFLGLVPSDDGLIELERQFEWEWQELWGNDEPPDWVSHFGQDHYGKWIEFEIKDVVQRLRWIPPGRFVMGSPAAEAGRYDGEGPQHAVTIGEGFWLFDTPVTQSLWQVVMGDNPSRFKSPDRAVEEVSWDEVQGFLERLNGLVPGLDLQLPSEAQWEYACRAGTETAIWTGPLEILGKRNAPALDAIAWYGGNSGEGFELEDGHDSSVWEEKQYPHTKAGTQPVGLKAASPWGLHDMLGNVWEWCADDWHEGYDGAPTDGSAWLDASSESGVRGRVGRGGSWVDDARSVRAACRLRIPRGYRYVFLGFRCARGQVVSTGRPEVVASVAAGRGAEPRPAAADAAARQRGAPWNPGTAGIASVRVATGGAAAYAPLPSGPFVLRTDLAELAIARLTKTELGWAEAVGRDRFGLWSDVTVDDVRQRLRWMPPGRYVMGSPTDEVGRDEAEGPQHSVTLGAGFWLFDTPVTQALWQAVMGDNPSRFKSLDRPVEQVSWDDVQSFLERLNGLVPGLDLELPSEAQWEYACRAGMATALWTGPLEILGERNAPALDAIAWYSGNCGEGFELEDGYDSSDWPEKQYPHSKAGTRPVGLKAANPWGLHDMLGNVWEWCADDWHEGYDGAPTDGSAWLDASSESGERVRVFRGGSWRVDARFVRAACRVRYPQGYRFADLGFRCARGQS